jgi:hypothetical protein
LRTAAKDDVEVIKAEFNQKEMEVIKHQERLREITANRVKLQKRIDRSSNF